MSDLVSAISEKTVRRLFVDIINNIQPYCYRNQTSGSLSFNLDVCFKPVIRDDTIIDLTNNNTIKISELDIVWDTFKVGLGFDIPEICVGGWCVVPNPFDDCLVRLPEICIFERDPDISITLDLSKVITSEISITTEPVVRYVENNQNKWQVFFNPLVVDIDIFDIADIIGDMLERALNDALGGVLSILPDWAREAIENTIGRFIDYVRRLLDIPDDIGEWLSDILGRSLGLFNYIVTVLSEFFASRNPLEIKDPLTLPLDSLSEKLPILVPDKDLNPVKIPITALSVKVNDTELIVEASIGR